MFSRVKVYIANRYRCTPRVITITTSFVNNDIHQRRHQLQNNISCRPIINVVCNKSCKLLAHCHLYTIYQLLFVKLLILF